MSGGSEATAHCAPICTSNIQGNVSNGAHERLWSCREFWPFACHLAFALVLKVSFFHLQCFQPLNSPIAAFFHPKGQVNLHSSSSVQSLLTVGPHWGWGSTVSPLLPFLNVIFFIPCAGVHSLRPQFLLGMNCFVCRCRLVYVEGGEPRGFLCCHLGPTS